MAVIVLLSVRHIIKFVIVSEIRTWTRLSSRGTPSAVSVAGQVPSVCFHANTPEVGDRPLRGLLSKVFLGSLNRAPRPLSQ